jgi:hypothetical protein
VSCNNYKKRLPFIEFVDLKENKTAVEITTKSLNDLSIWVQDSTGKGIYVQFRNGTPSIFSETLNGNANGNCITFEKENKINFTKYYTGKHPKELPLMLRNDSLPYRVNVLYGNWITIEGDSVSKTNFGWGTTLEKLFLQDSLKK